MTSRPVRPGGCRAPASTSATPVAFADARRGASRSEHGRLDLLFNNAGIGMGGEVAELTLAHWDRVIDVNLRGVVHGVAAAYPVMIRQGRGHIVNTASLAGLLPAPMLTPYARHQARRGRPEHEPARRGGAPRRAGQRRLPRDHRHAHLGQGQPRRPARGRRACASSLDALKPTVMRRAYPPAALAEDVLDGVARNRPIIVAPEPRPDRAGGCTASPRACSSTAGRRMVAPGPRELTGSDPGRQGPSPGLGAGCDRPVACGPCRSSA